jgi:hypothetical protein
MKTCCCTHQTFSWGFQLAGHLLHQLHANKFFGTINHRAIKSNQGTSPSRQGAEIETSVPQNSSVAVAELRNFF